MNKKQIFAFLLSASLILTSVPFPAAAAGETASPAVTAPAAEAEPLMTTTTAAADMEVIPDFAPDVTYDKSPMRVGETRRIHVEHPLNSRVSRVSLYSEDTSCYEWNFDEDTADIVITALKPCDSMAIEIYAEGCAFSRYVYLTILDAETTQTTVLTQETGYTTTTEIIQTPIITCDHSPMHIGETRRIHLEAPLNSKIRWAFLFSNDESCYEWYFDEDTADIVITAQKTCNSMPVEITADGCALGGYISLTILDGETTQTTVLTQETGYTTTTTAAHTAVTDPVEATVSAMTTTTIMTTTTVIADYIPYVTCDTSPMCVGETRRIHVEHPQNGKVSRASLYSEDTSCYEWYFDKDTSDIVITAQKPCDGMSLRISAEGCEFSRYVSLTILDAKTTEPTTRPATEPETESHCTVTMIDADDSPMQVGEIRAVRFFDPDTGTARACYVDEYTDNFSYYYEEGTDVIYITALRAGELRIGLWTGTTAFTGILTLDVTDGGGTESGGKKLQKLGNINNDDAIDAGDATNILQEAARIGTGAERELHGTLLAAADVNFDGKINAEDATVVLVYAAIRGTNENPPEFAEYLIQRMKQKAAYSFLGSCRSGNTLSI